MSRRNFPQKRGRVTELSEDLRTHEIAKWEVMWRFEQKIQVVTHRPATFRYSRVLLLVGKDMSSIHKQRTDPFDLRLYSPVYKVRTIFEGLQSLYSNGGNRFIKEHSKSFLSI